MRIGVNALFLIPGEVGGSQTYLCETLVAMACEWPQDSFVVFTQRENDAWLRKRLCACRNISFKRLNFRASNRAVRILREQLELPFHAGSSAIDVLWSPGYTAPAFCRVPQCVSILDMQYRHFPEDLSWLARLATHILVSVAARRCQRILAISAFTKMEVSRWTSARPDKIIVTPLAASPLYAEPLAVSHRQGLLDELLPPGETCYLLCIAHSYPHKNIPCLIEAWNRVAERIPHRLVWVGRPQRGEKAVQQALACVREPERIVRLEQVSFEQIVALYQGASLFVFPSLYEGFGLPVLEAMMAGIPVLTSDIPTAHEIGGDTVHLVDGHRPEALADQILAVLAEAPAVRDRRVARARERAAAFCWRRTAQLTREALAC